MSSAAVAPAGSANVIPFQLRQTKPFTQVPNEYIEAMAYLSGAAFKCLIYIARHSLGFHRGEVRLSLDDFCHGRKRSDGTRMDEGTGLSKPSVIGALAELEQAGLVEGNDAQVGRTVARTYTLTTPKQQQQPEGAESPTCQETLQGGTGQETLQAREIASKAALQVGSPTWQEPLPHERKSVRNKETSPSPSAHAREAEVSTTTPHHAEAEAASAPSVSDHRSASEPVAARAATSRPSTRLDKLHPSDREAAWRVIDILRESLTSPLASAWPADDAADSKMLSMLMASDIPVEFITWRAEVYALHQGEGGRPLKRSQAAFHVWCTGDVATDIRRRWVAEHEIDRVSPSTHYAPGKGKERSSNERSEPRGAPPPGAGAAPSRYPPRGGGVTPPDPNANGAYEHLFSRPWLSASRSSGQSSGQSGTAGG